MNKIIKILCGILLLSTLQSCPVIGEEVCDDMEASAQVPDLQTISPLKSVYKEGEEIIFKMVIPSENTYFGSPTNLYQKTGVNNAWLITNTDLFSQNSVTYIKGSKRDGSDNWFNAVYNPSNEQYELEIKIKFHKKGNYSFISSDRVDFLGTPKCNRNFINTNIQGRDESNQRIEFVVE